MIVTDLTMPEMSGIQLLDALRVKGVSVPVIVATAMNDVAHALEAVRAGAVDYLAKPVDADALVFAIERALRVRTIMRDAALLRQSNEALAIEAEKNLRAREELLSIVAHDLRGPLSTILLATAMHEPVPGDRATVRTLQIVQRAATRMSKLVEELLDVARIEGGSLKLDLDSHRAKALLQEVMGMMEPVAAEHGVRLEVVIEEDFSVRCAFARIVQVLVNLVANAINVTGEGKLVKLLASRTVDEASFAVADEGPGIPEAHLVRVFEHGWRTDGGKRQGAGLGLSIAKGIVEAHAGTIGVDSTVGEGSRFHFAIPLAGLASSSWQVSAE